VKTRSIYLLLALAIVIAGGSILKEWWKGRAEGPQVNSLEGIEILGTSYSLKLKALYEKVAAAFQKPIEVVEVFDRVDNQIEIQPDKIILRLHWGASEDNVAHELMHAILQSEGYPQPFAVRAIDLANRLHQFIVSDFDHLVIKEKLLREGYDARSGFLSLAESFENVLKLSAPNTPDVQTVLIIGLLHELVKYHYYIGRVSAEEAILQKFPRVSPYWHEFSGAIQQLPVLPSPEDMWGLIVIYLGITNRLSNDLGASFKLSDLIGFEPIPLRRRELTQPASSIFYDRTDAWGIQQMLVRTYARKGDVLVWAGVVGRANWPVLRGYMDFRVDKFAEIRGIHLHVLK
jgi:hypothetical protein